MKLLGAVCQLLLLAAAVRCGLLRATARASARHALLVAADTDGRHLEVDLLDHLGGICGGLCLGKVFWTVSERLFLAPLEALFW